MNMMPLAKPLLSPLSGPLLTSPKMTTDIVTNTKMIHCSRVCLVPLMTYIRKAVTINLL